MMASDEASVIASTLMLLAAITLLLLLLKLAAALWSKDPLSLETAAATEAAVHGHGSF